MGMDKELLNKLSNKMFSAEVYNNDYNGVEICNLLCMGDVYEILEEYFEGLPIKFNEFGYNECPVCQFSVDTDDNYCSNCGQKIYLKTED